MLRSLAAAALAALLTAAGAGSAVASAGSPDPVNLIRGSGGGEGEVLLTPRAPGNDGANRGGSGGSASAGRASTATQTCTHMRHPISCTDPWGVWWQDLQCWVKRASPQPASDSSIWGGRTDGAVYWCQPPPVPGAIGGGHFFWAPTAGQPGAPVLVDPVTLAEQAIEQMQLSAIRVGITPPEGPDTYTLLGLPTWMWVDEPSSTTWGPITESASAGPVTVTATARVSSVVWDMGDSTRTTCGKGTAYEASFDAASSPTCGHRYDAPGRYAVTATSNWTVDWAGAGQSGTITFALTRDASVWVRQAHGLVSEQG